LEFIQGNFGNPSTMKIKKAKKRTTLTESWMEGIPEDNTYILSIVEARSPCVRIVVAFIFLAMVIQGAASE